MAVETFAERIGVLEELKLTTDVQEEVDAINKTIKRFQDFLGDFENESGFGESDAPQYHKTAF